MTNHLPPELECTKILIVEDERIVALDLKQTLIALGYHVVGMAASKEDAVRLTMSYQPDLILMDINLGPGGDGIAAAQEVRRFAEVPIVFLTAYADNETLRRASTIAPYGYLVKPVQQRELNAVVQMALARFRATYGRLQAERRLRLALDSARMGIVTLSEGADLVEIDGHFPPVADQSLQGFRLPLAEFYAHLSAEAHNKVENLIKDGGDLHFVTRWQSPSSETPGRWLEVHASYIPNESTIVGICRDVTLQIQQEEALRQAAVVFESAADAILILDAEGRITTANPAFTLLTGWRISSIRNRHPNDFLHARRGSDCELLNETPLDFLGHAEVTCIREDGSMFPAWEHVAPVRNELGEITQRVLTFTDISALRTAESRVRHLAYHDPLTDLGNRNHLRESLQALDEGERAMLMFLDLDGFKVINDSLGHDAGDQLLVAISQRLGCILRHNDEAIRLGGDEFVLLLRGIDETEVVNLAQRVLDVVRAPVELLPGNSVQVSVSIGIAAYPCDGKTADALLRSADIAMYSAKSSGRNRFARYHPSMAEVANERLVIEQGLMQAMHNGELSLHWQPQVSLDEERLVGAEALLRWHSKRNGFIAPDRFIPIAEESGLIQSLGLWVMQEALATWTQWWRSGLVKGRVAINVSALQLQDDGFPEQIAKALQSSGLPANLVEIEVTETALQYVPQVDQKLSRITDLGVCVALDDFGTGYSSLSMLKLLPLHRLKVDRAFVREVVGNSSDQAIVRAIVAMADALGLELIAEGVEDRAQRDWLYAVGVHEAQGWLFAKAMPAQEFECWLQDH